MFEFIAVVVLANLIMLAVLFVLRHVIAIRAPVLVLAVGISIIYCILYPFLVALISYPQVLYLYVFLVVAGAGSLYIIENRFFTVRELKEGEASGIIAGDALEAIGVEQTAVFGGLPALDWGSAGRVFSMPGQYAGATQEGPLPSVHEEKFFVQEEAGGQSSAAGDVREDTLSRYEDEGTVDAVAIEYIPESGLPEYLETEAADPAAGPVSAALPEEDMPVMADKAAEGQITGDEVAALLKATYAGEPEGAVEDIAFYKEDEIADAEEGPGPADVQVEDVTDRDDYIAGGITATMERLDKTGPVETMEEAWLARPYEEEFHIDTEECLPEEEASVLAFEEKTEVQGGERPITVTGLPEGLETETSVMAAAIPVEDASGLDNEIIAGYITEDEVAAIEELAAFAEGTEPAELSVADIPGWDDAVADEITATLEGLDVIDPVLTVEETVLAGVDASSFIDELLPVEQEFTEQTADGAGEKQGDVTESMAEPDYIPAEEQSSPGYDLNSMVAIAFDKLASGDDAGAVDCFFRALKLGPPPRLAVLLCTRISSIYSSQGHSRQALAVMEMLEVVWGPMLDDSQLKGITTIIIQLRGEV